MKPNGKATIGGVVLCGGRSSRMGRPKASLPFGTETLLQRVVRILGEAVSPIVVVAAPEQRLPSLPAEVLVARDERENLGPLAGLAVGLNALKARAEAAYVSACDVPLLRPSFVRSIIRIANGHDIAIPREGKYRHPLAAVYRTALAAEVDALVAANRMRPIFLLERCDAVEVDVEQLRDVDPELDSLRNLNTPEEYRAALRDVGLPDGVTEVDEPNR